MSIEEKSSKERSELRQSLERQKEQSADRLRQELLLLEQRLRADHKSEIDDMMARKERDHRDEIKRISDNYESEIRNLSEQLHEKMERQLTELSKQTSAIDQVVANNYREKLAEEIGQIERNLLAEFKNREEQAQIEFDRAHEAEIEAIEQTWKQQSEELEKSLRLKTDECQLVREELEQVQETAKRMAELMASDYEQQLRQLEEKIGTEVKHAEEQTVARERERIKTEFFAERDRIESDLREELALWRGKCDELEISIDTLNRTVADLKVSRDDAIAAAKLAANEIVLTSGKNLGVFRLLTCLIQHIHHLIGERTDELIRRPSIEGNSLMECLALVRDRQLPSMGECCGDADIAVPFQEVQLWIVEKFESLINLVDAALVQSDMDRDFVMKAKQVVNEREKQMAIRDKAIEELGNELQTRLDEIQKKDAEIDSLRESTLELIETVEKLDSELKITQTRELQLMEEVNSHVESQKARFDDQMDKSLQCDELVSETENQWAQQFAELDAAATKRIEEAEQQLSEAIQKADESQQVLERIRTDYELRLSDSAQHLASKEQTLRSLRKFVDEQVAEREAEQEEYQKQIVKLQQNLAERQRSLDIANGKLVLFIFLLFQYQIVQCFYFH